MDRATNEAIDLLVSLMIFATLISLPVFVTINFLARDWAGFKAVEDKSARTTVAEILPQERIITRDDVMYTLAVADANTPAPAILDINGTQVHLNSTFFENRLPYMAVAYSAMPNNLPYRYSLFAGNSGLRFWKYVER
jgi:hypothetical protein